MIKVGIIGGAGYTAGELIRILIGHPKVKIDFVLSESQSGGISGIHRDLQGETDLEFVKKLPEKQPDILFLCQGHGKSRKFFEENPVQDGTRYMDLSQDFRHFESNRLGRYKFVYGLSEFRKKEIAKARFVANPGCFATVIELSLLPIVKEKEFESLHVHAITGSTGAGQSLSETTHFSWRDNNVSIYKPFTHQHEKEILETLELNDGNDRKLYFVPVRGNFTRGIFSSAYTTSKLSIEDLQSIYNKYYKNSPFVKISNEPVDMKQVINTNKCLIYLEKMGDIVLITSVIDNLLKGASGQAVQNMNIMFGLPEDTGLKLKSNYF